MVNQIDIILQGQNRTAAAFQQVRRDLDGIARTAKSTPLTVNTAGLKTAQADLQATGGAAEGLASVLTGRLAGAFTVAGAAAAAMKLGGLFLEFGALGETVQRSEKYFTAFSGSAQLAAANLAAMQRATEGALSTQEAMNAGASILGMGLAKNADELEQFARMAVLLGGNTRTATEAINEFQLLIANQSILRLDTFGISGARVRERIEELQAATTGLTREQAFLDAVMEEGTRKMQQLEAEGVRAGTSAERLAAQTKDLKAEFAELVAQPYTIVIEQVIKQTQGINDLIGGFNDNRIALNVDEGVEARLETIASAIQRLEEQKQRFNDGSDLSILKQGMADIQIGELRALQSQLQAYGASAETVRVKLDDYLAASLRVAQAQDELNGIAQTASPIHRALAQAELQTAQAARDSALAAYQAAEGYARQANDADLTKIRLLGLADANREVAAAAANLPTTTGTFTEPSKTRWGLYTDWARNFEQSGPDPVKEWVERKRREEEAATRDSQKAAKASAAAWDAAYQQVAGRIEGYLSQGMSNAEGLFDLTPDMFAPGANGAFENIFRALDVAQLGDKSPWASVLGLTQEDAKRISADFQRGIFSEGVQGLINVDALVNEARMADLAQKSKDAFVKAIAQKAGVGTTVVGAMFGLESGGGTGQGTASGAQQAVDSAMQQVAGALGDTVAGKDFAGRIIGYGDRIWGYFEQGIVDKAKASTALERAIYAMVSAAISGQTGGSVGDAVRGGGGQ